MKLIPIGHKCAISHPSQAMTLTNQLSEMADKLASSRDNAQSRRLLMSMEVTASTLAERLRITLNQ